MYLPAVWVFVRQLAFLVFSKSLAVWQESALPIYELTSLYRFNLNINL
jgi:hypothetical protein